MSLPGKIRQLDFAQFWSLFKVFVTRPLYIFPTYKATQETVKIADSLYGSAHHQNNVTNAFRHALWNFMIAKKCLRQNSSVEKSIDWAQTITDLHEKLMPNQNLLKAMDLHNNAVGRKMFAKYHQLNNEKEIIKIFTDLIPEAVKITNTKALKDYKNQMVYTEAYEHER
ncbi:DUF6973 domain-containing protein [Mesonia ostreae]|uniref:DUF6973 domain-containing protein n=1 Tax=Mesonia ostreae TaxID=861110 RepID=A0ABU2KIB9_9FLAO|nr:hypothetical protein [Mesonia ostreae]MDT0294413.1 hypothetical protein [Mesonia ostreae]